MPILIFSEKWTQNENMTTVAVANGMLKDNQMWDKFAS